MSKRTPPAWANDTAKAFNALWHNRRKEIEGAVTGWTAWEIAHRHDNDKPAMPEAARLGYACAVMIGTVNKVAADSPESLAMLTGLESAPVPDGLAGVCLAAVAPDGWPASKREILEAWGRVAESFASNAKPAADIGQHNRPRKPNREAEEKRRREREAKRKSDRETFEEWGRYVKEYQQLKLTTKLPKCELFENAHNMQNGTLERLLDRVRQSEKRRHGNKR